MILGTIGAIMGCATAVATLFARTALDFILVPKSLTAGFFALALSAFAAIAAAEAAAHPRGSGAVMAVAGVGGYVALGADFAVAAALLVMAGVIALVMPPAHPHHDLPRMLRLGS